MLLVPHKACGWELTGLGFRQGFSTYATYDIIPDTFSHWVLGIFNVESFADRNLRDYLGKDYIKKKKACLVLLSLCLLCGQLSKEK